MYIRKLLLIFAGLFVCMTLGGIIMAYLAGMPIKYEEQLAEGFYYSAIGFAVYHIFTRNKQIREAKAKKEQEEAARAETGDNGDDGADAFEEESAEDSESPGEADENSEKNSQEKIPV